ncbi:MAG: rhodanese-like domain-containing protein, partial [Chthoniobacterales bacterium]
LDVNGTESYDKGHIPGAIDYTANKKKIASLLPSDKSALIVAYCGNEHCGAYAAAAQAAKDLGYTNVQHFKPGIAGWKSEGGKIEAVK